MVNNEDEKNKSLENIGFSRLSWRKRWDSNPRAREGYLISSQARYDHFDTLPYMLTRRSEVNANYSIFRNLFRKERVRRLSDAPRLAL